MTPGFHWFVAWRYLMARPRSISASVVAVAGAAFIVSAVTGGGNAMISRGIEAGFASDWAYRNVLVAAVALCGIGGLGLLYSLVRYSMMFPERIGVPLAALAGLFLCAIGAAASGSLEASTSLPNVGPLGAGTVTSLLNLGPLITGAVFTGVSAIVCWRQARVQTSGGMMLAAMMFAAAGATVFVARYALEPMSLQAMTYAPDRVLLPSLGLLILGTSVALWGSIRYFSTPQRGQSIAGVALILLAGSAVYPMAARSMLADEELVQLEPMGERFAQYIEWAGWGMLAAAAAIAGLAIAVFLMGKRRQTAAGDRGVVRRSGLGGRFLPRHRPLRPRSADLSADVVDQPGPQLPHAGGSARRPGHRLVGRDPRPGAQRLHVLHLGFGRRCHGRVHGAGHRAQRHERLRERFAQQDPGLQRPCSDHQRRRRVYRIPGGGR